MKRIGRKIVLLSLVFGTYCYAETTSIRLNKTTVANSGFNTELKNENKNVTIVSTDDISNKGYNRVGDVLENSPFLHTKLGNDGNSTTLDLRGQGENASANVKVLVDEVPINILDTTHGAPPLNSLAVGSISQIEIIPGSGSVLYGNGASGGTVNIETKSKRGEQYKNAFAKYGSFSNRNLGLGLGSKVMDNLYLSADANMQDIKGYRKNDQRTVNSFAGSAIYEFIQGHKISGSARIYDDKGITSGAVTKAVLSKDRQASGDLMNFKSNKKDYSIGYDGLITDKWNLKLVSYYQDIKADSVQDVSFGGGKGTQDADFHEKKTAINAKNKLSYLDNNGELIIGYEYSKNTLDRHSIVELPMYKMNIENNLGKDTHSAFILNKYKILSPLELSLGYRQEWVHYSIKRLDKRSGSKVDTNKDMTNNAYNSTLNYKFSDTDNVYIAFEKGYVSPSPTQLTDNIVGKGYVLNNLKSEDSYNYELGYRGSVFGSYLMASVFYSQKKNEIFQELTGNHRAWKFYNLNGTERTGLEVFAEQYLGDFTFNQSATYINAKVTKGQNKGKHIAQVPNTKLTASVTYIPMQNLSLNVKGKYYGESYEKLDNKEKISSFGTVDASVTYEIANKMSITTGVDNIFEQKYNIYTSDGKFIPAPVRTYYVTLNYDL